MVLVRPVSSRHWPCLGCSTARAQCGMIANRHPTSSSSVAFLIGQLEAHIVHHRGCTMDLASLTLQWRVDGESISRHQETKSSGNMSGDCWSLGDA